MREGSVGVIYNFPDRLPFTGFPAHVLIGSGNTGPEHSRGKTEHAPGLFRNQKKKNGITSYFFVRRAPVFFLPAAFPAFFSGTAFTSQGKHFSSRSSMTR
jgi:hypothetical protein